MPEHRPSALGILIEREQAVLLSRWRAQVRELPSARHLDTPTLTDHIPRFITELSRELRADADVSIADTITEANETETAPEHGVQRFADNFDIEEVVAEYNLLRGCVHDLATEHGLDLQGRPFHVLNRVLDSAIGGAVQAYAAQQTLQMQRRREDYLAFVAHDLRNPLSAISLSGRVLDMLLVAPEADLSRARVLLRTLHRNVARMTELIAKVLEENIHRDAEDSVRLERREFELWPVVEELLLELSPVSDAGRTKLVNMVPDECIVYADASHLRRVFQNLIANAIAYAPGGTVVVGAREASDRDSIECFVQDDGDGIPADRIATVFEMHESDPEREGGHGLGLAIVKAFVEAHDGRVWVESESGKGAVFRFELPRRHPT